MPLRTRGYGILVVLLMGVLCCVSSAPAQQDNPPLLRHSGIPALPNTQLRVARSVPDTVRVLALMVEFQQDTDPRTTGNGSFMLSPAGEPIIDPAPHDSAYFAHKLLFLENYFRKSSDGKLIVKGDVWGSRVTLGKPMAEYSPAGDGSDNKPLADFILESWQATNALNPAIPFSSYDAFILFHAGVGRDIDLVSLLGFNPTPDDIPSLYVSLESLRNYLNDPGYAGVPVQNGSFLITHTMILPETETRVIASAGRSDTLLIGMNGLLASSFGSYLGLPDLFDTNTGNTAIGQFGLMDVASIFSFNGMFPPEPSAWEKIFLGWVEPIVLNSPTQTIALPAVSASSNDTVYKIPISAKEYYLLENRSRDPEQNGQLVTTIQNGQLVTRHFERDTIGFATSNIGGLRGSLIDVENFDWAIPGQITNSGVTDGGGILIWHIDENIIESKFAANRVNADPNRRGVALEEADGALDIGQVYDIFNPGLGSEFGSPFDCWYEQNNTPIYRNIFDGTTFPNSNSNSGAKTGISITDISPRSSRMTATVQIGDTQVQKLAPFSRSIGASPAATYPTVTPRGVFVGNGNAVYAFQANGLSKTSDPTGLFFDKGGERGVAVFSGGSNAERIVGVQDSSVYIWDARDTDSNGLYDTVSTIVVTLTQKVVTMPSLSDLSLVSGIVVGGEQGKIWELDLQGNILREYGDGSNPIHSITQLPSSSLSRPTYIFYTSGERIVGESASYALGNASLPWLLVSAGSIDDQYLVAAQLGGTRVVAVDKDLNTRLYDISLSQGPISALAAGDVDLDGNKDVLISAGERLYAINKTGSILDGYPVKLQGETFSGSPLIGDIDGDGKMDVVSLTSNGSVVAYDAKGQLKSRFPFQTISQAGQAALFQTSNDKVGIVAVSQNGEMQAWELSAAYNPTTMQWTQALGNSHHTNSEQSVVQSPQPKSSEFLPKSLVYNWPNPVYGSSTQIRYFVSENADVTVKIFDLVGSKITELTGRAVGGIDNEITWDVTSIQSGVYLAHVEVRTSAKTESAVVKIAVIK